MIEHARFLIATVICQRHPPGSERDAWLRWLDAISRGDLDAPRPRIAKLLSTGRSCMTRDEFIEKLDEAALVFGDTRDTLWLVLGSELPPVMEWSLMDMVGEILEVVRTESERDDMRQLASHFEYLASLIRKTLDEDEA